MLEPERTPMSERHAFQTIRDLLCSEARSVSVPLPLVAALLGCPDAEIRIGGVVGTYVTGGRVNGYLTEYVIVNDPEKFIDYLKKRQPRLAAIADAALVDSALGDE